MSLSPFNSFQSRFVTYLSNFPRNFGRQAIFSLAQVHLNHYPAWRNAARYRTQHKNTSLSLNSFFFFLMSDKSDFKWTEVQ